MQQGAAQRPACPRCRTSAVASFGPFPPTRGCGVTCVRGVTRSASRAPVCKRCALTPSRHRRRSQTGRTPLHEAARNGCDSVATALLDHGADVNATESVRACALGCLPLQLCCFGAAADAQLTRSEARGRRCTSPRTTATRPSLRCCCGAERRRRRRKPRCAAAALDGEARTHAATWPCALTPALYHRCFMRRTARHRCTWQLRQTSRRWCQRCWMLEWT